MNATTVSLPVYLYDYPQVTLPLGARQRKAFLYKVDMAFAANKAVRLTCAEVGAVGILLARLQELEKACLERDWKYVKQITPKD